MYIGPIRPYFAQNRWFLPDIAWVGHIDPYNEYISIRLDSRITLVVPGPYTIGCRTYLYRACIVWIGSKGLILPSIGCLFLI